MSDITKIRIHTNSAKIEGLYYAGHPAKSVLILHPSPLYGGNMHNKVVQSIHSSFAANEFSTLRIDFRKQNNVNNKFDYGRNELMDALIAVDWLTNRGNFLQQIWVAGYAFGAYITLKAIMRRPECNGFIAVTPPTECNDLNLLTPCPTGLFIHGGKDHIADPIYAKTLSETLARQKNAEMRCVYLDEADHYYRNARDLLEETCSSYIKEYGSDLSFIPQKKRKRLNKKKINIEIASSI